MSVLANKLTKEDRAIKRKIYFLTLVYKDKIGKRIQRSFDEATKTIFHTLLYYVHEDTTYAQIISSGVLNSLRQNLDHNFQTTAREIETFWIHQRRKIDLLSRIGVSLIGKKSAPPWKRTKIDLKNKLSTEDKYDPRKGHFRFYFAKMTDSIMQQIQQGIIKEESLNKIIKRIDNLVDRKKLRNVREQIKEEEKKEDIYYAGPVDIEYGFYTPDDILELKQDMIEANQFEYRQYRPWFSKEVLKNNKQLYLLDQMLNADALNLINSGNIESMPQLEGIEDMVWLVQRPGVCDCCDSRDGLTSKEIKANIKDEYGDMPPPLHPNCNCEYIPKLSKDWEDKDLEDQGVTWDPWTGNLKVPKDVQTKYRTDLDLTDFLSQISSGGYNE